MIWSPARLLGSSAIQVHLFTYLNLICFLQILPILYNCFCVLGLIHNNLYFVLKNLLILAIERLKLSSIVVMEASRPACLYPVDERSYGSNWFYCERKAESTKYYFQVLAEEKTNLSESFYVTQAGVFNSGLVEIESLYAPEYRGHTGAVMVESKAY